MICWLLKELEVPFSAHVHEVTAINLLCHPRFWQLCYLRAQAKLAEGFPEYRWVCMQDRAAVHSPENRKIHPLGKVPAIKDEHGTMFESGAILQYVLKNYAGGRLDPATSDVAAQQRFLQWCWFAEANLGAFYTLINQHSRFLPQDQRVPQACLVAIGTRA